MFGNESAGVGPGCALGEKRPDGCVPGPVRPFSCERVLIQLWNQPDSSFLSSSRRLVQSCSQQRARLVSLCFLTVQQLDVEQVNQRNEQQV